MCLSTRIHSFSFSVATLVLFGLAPMAAHATDIYTDSDSFFAAIGNYYTESFDGLPTGGGGGEGGGGPFGPASIGGGGKQNRGNKNGVGTSDLPESVDFSGNGFSYTVSAPSNGLFVIDHGGGDHWLSTNSFSDALVFTFTSGNVTAVGGNFFSTDGPGNFVAEEMAFSLSDGTSYFFAPGSSSDFVGFITDPSNPITSLTVGISELSGNYPTANDFTVGSAVVPEASTLGMLTLALPVLGYAIARRRSVSRKCS